MKTFIIILTFLLFKDSLAIANEHIIKKAEHLSKEQKYFLALELYTSTNKVLTENIKSQIEIVTTQTGTNYFNTLENDKLRLINTETTKLLLSKRYNYEKKYDQAISLLKDFPQNHRFLAESLLTLGVIYQNKGIYNDAIEAFKKCTQIADKLKIKSTIRVRKYFEVISNNCKINNARIYFQLKQFENAIEYYNLVEKTSFNWPYTLLEKAWANYHLKNYNRSLGILITYNSPLLESYFNPEVEYLKALNYFRLCLYDDAFKIIERYYEVYSIRSNELKTIIDKSKKSDDYFLQLITNQEKNIQTNNPFLRSIITQVGKKVKYNLDINSHMTLLKEIEITTNKNELSKLLEIKREIEKEINHYIKLSFYNLINNINKYSYELLNLKLEVFSQKKELFYKNHSFSNDRTRGSHENISRKPNEEFWKFHNAFWADELGDYSFGLTSECKNESKNE